MCPAFLGAEVHRLLVHEGASVLVAVTEDDRSGHRFFDGFIALWARLNIRHRLTLHFNPDAWASRFRFLIVPDAHAPVKWSVRRYNSLAQ